MTGTRSVLSVLLLMVVVPVTGCAWTVRGLSLPENPSPNDLLVTFNQIELNKSTSGDVLASVRYPDDQLIVQAQNTLGISGPRTPVNRTWLTMVSFGESLAVSGKYFVLVDDKPKAFMYKKFTRARLDAEKIVTPEVLTKNYPDEETKNVAILRDILTGFNASATEIKLSDTRSRSCAMAVDQLMNQILTRFKITPAEAMHFDCAEGIAFEHPTMGKGRFRMVLDGEIVKLKMIVGSVSDDMEKLPDVQSM